ncbi:polysulfide reductase NrfD [Slackia piriformis]|nr:polysulfide reductase NrfD [Slackia piriformis]
MEMEWPLILFTFFVCLASGILLAQGVLTVLGKGKQMQLASLVSSLVALAVGGISVFFHLQHWERIFNGFGHITSGITLEFIGCVVFFVVLVVYFLMMRRAEDGMAPKWCGVLAIIMGVAMPAITGDSYLMEAIPVWDTFLLPVYYVFNAVFFGGLSVLVIAALTKCDDVNDTAIWLAIGGGVATAVALIAYAVFINSLGGVYSDITYYFDPTLPDSSMIDVQEDFVGTVLAGSNAPLFWIGAVIVGVALPVIAAFMAKRALAGGKQQQVLPLAGAGLACALAGGICWRMILYMVAVSIFALY